MLREKIYLYVFGAHVRFFCSRVCARDYRIISVRYIKSQRLRYDNRAASDVAFRSKIFGCDFATNNSRLTSTISPGADGNTCAAIVCGEGTKFYPFSLETLRAPCGYTEPTEPFEIMLTVLNTRKVTGHVRPTRRSDFVRRTLLAARRRRFIFIGSSLREDLRRLFVFGRTIHLSIRYIFPRVRF